MDKVLIEIEYEIEVEGCVSAAWDIIEQLGLAGSAVVCDDYNILIHSMAVVEADRWIPVEEGLPEKADNYFIVRQGKCSVCYFDGQRFGWGSRKYPVTHYRKITLPKE